MGMLWHPEQARILPSPSPLRLPWMIASSGSSLLFGRLTLSAQRPGEDFPISPLYFLPDILFEQVFAFMYKSSHGNVYGISSTLLFPFILSQPFRWQFQAYFLQGIFLMVSSILIFPFSKLVYYYHLHQINQKFNKLVHFFLFLGLLSSPVFPSVLLHLVLLSVSC